jgi:hypothetical protein
VAEMAHVRLTINGHPYEGHCKPRKLLSISCKSIPGRRPYPYTVRLLGGSPSTC